MIDTKKAREMRAAGTGGEWEAADETNFADVYAADGNGHVWVAEVGDYDDAQDNARLIAYAVNQITPMADEIDRLRAALKSVTSFIPREWETDKVQDGNCTRTITSCRVCRAWADGERPPKDGHRPGCSIVETRAQVAELAGND